MEVTRIFSTAVTGPSEVSSNQPSLLAYSCIEGSPKPCFVRAGVAVASKNKQATVTLLGVGANQLAEGVDGKWLEVLGRKELGRAG